MIKLRSLPLTTYLHGNNKYIYTAILARTLDRYLFSDEEVNNAAAYHQLPSRKKDGHTDCAEAPDVYILKCGDNGIPDIPLLVCDFKKDINASHQAAIETHAYGLTVNEVCYDKQIGQVFLGLAGTPNSYQLYLYSSCSGHMHYIKSWQFESDSDFKNMLYIIVTSFSHSILLYYDNYN